MCLHYVLFMSNQQMIQQEPWNQQEKSVPVAVA